MAKGKSTGKVRFDGLDVAAMVTQLATLTGRRVINIYDGVSDADSFLLKLDGSSDKTLVFLESGIRIHTTRQPSLQQEGMPSPFCSKLRKHLRGLRLERIAQLGNYDRVVHLVFGTGAKRHSLILELYARGNLILTNASYEIMALLRSHDYQDHAVQVKVGQVYPVTFATSLGSPEEGSESTVSKGILDMTGSQALEWAKSVMAPREESAVELTKKQKKNESGIPLKALLLKPSSGVYHYGPSLLEHCILCANLDPDVKIKAENVTELLEPSDWDSLTSSLRDEGSKVMNTLSTDEVKGYVLYRPKPGNEEESNETKVNGLQHRDKVLEEFQPHLLKQHEGRPVIEYDSFSEAVDDFFAHIGGQKQALRAEAAEAMARDRLEKVRKDLANRIKSLEKEQETLKQHAQLVEIHAEDVDKALGVINSALDTGMDWEALEQLVEAEQKNENPIALLIKRLDLEKDAMVLALPSTVGADGSTVDITVSLRESAYGNASDMFARYRAAKEKSEKTTEATSKALKAAEAVAQRDLADAFKRSKLTTDVGQKRRPHWFEKFHWMITSDNYLVVGGKDAQQNEMLVKRYLRAGDAYLHADVHGASSCILRAKRKRAADGKTEAVALPDQALREAGTFTICRSSAWTSRMVTSAYWVESNQVSKTAPTGEYLTVGSFMVRGKKNYLPPSQLEMGLAVLFRLGDEDSIARHKNERRDFSLLDVPDYDDDGEDEPILMAEPPKDKKSTHVVTTKSRPSVDSAEAIDKTEPDDESAAVSSPINEEEEENKNSPALRSTEPNGKSTPELPISQDKKKKGYSAKDRKLIKKHGSLEAAEKATLQRDGPSAREVDPSGSVPLIDEAKSSDTSFKRGKKTKLKRAAKKYADQDDEDRELALLALHAGEKKDKKTNGKKNRAPVSAAQEKIAAETAALLVKSPEKVAQGLSDAVRDVFAECIAVKEPGASNPVTVTLRWDKFDADVLEQVIELESEEQQLAAAKRLLYLKQSTRIDNFSASLAGIVRTIRKYGHEGIETNLDTVADEGEAASKRKTKSEKEAEEDAWKATLAQEGIVDDDMDQDAIDDTIEISKLTGKPFPEDSILYAIPVCAPYQSLSQYKYRVKLTPGNQKRGKAAKQCVEILTNVNGDKTASGEQYRELIKRIGDNDWVQVICADVKISAPGASKAAKKQKSGGKKGKKK